MFHPQSSDSYEQEPLVFNLPPPPPDSPPLTPPPLRYSPETEFLSQLFDTDALLPPPPDDFVQSDLLLSSPPQELNIELESYELHDDDVITDVDAFAAADAGTEAISLEELIVLPPPHFSSAFDSDSPEDIISLSQGPDFPPPSPLRASLHSDELLQTLGDLPPPTEEYSIPIAHTALPEDTIMDARLGTRNAGLLGPDTRRVTELLTAAANSLNRDTDGSDRPTEASEFVRAALELITIQPKVRIDIPKVRN